jgi:hypothetical protein
MDVQESQSNWPEMRKTLGKPGFCSGEDRNRTFRCFANVFEEFERYLLTLEAGILPEIWQAAIFTCTNPLRARMRLFRFGPTHYPQKQVLPSWHLVLVSVAIPS